MSRIVNGLRNVLQLTWHYLVEAVWWVRHRTINRNHVVKIATLNPGWHDADKKILHAMFQVLVDFVEGEAPEENIDWEDTEEHTKAWKEIQFSLSVVEEYSPTAQRSASAFPYRREFP